jgi:hypothetical protein
LPLCSYLNGSVDIHSSHFSIFYVHITWRWPPIGAETCSKQCTIKSSTKTLLRPVVLRKSIIAYTRNRMQNPTIKFLNLFITYPLFIFLIYFVCHTFRQPTLCQLSQVIEMQFSSSHWHLGTKNYYLWKYGKFVRSENDVTCAHKHTYILIQYFSWVGL